MVLRNDKSRRVQQRIYAERPQCVAVVGDPRIGKTAFLDGLLAAGRAGDPEPPPRTRFGMLSLRDVRQTSPEAFLRAAVEALDPSPAGPAAPRSDASPGAYGLFEAEVRRSADEAGRIILLLDDFDTVTRSGDFPLPFFSFLRSLANNFPVAYVTTSRLDLQQLCALKEVEESPFFNIFQNVTLGPLDEAQTRAWTAERRGAAAGPGPEGDWVWSESGGLPAVIGAALDLLADGAAPNTAEAAAALDAAAAPYLAELWDHLAPEHRALVERVARGEPPGERDARPLRDLGPRRGYLVERGGRWTLASGALARHRAGQGGAPSSPGLVTRFRRFFGGGAR